MLLLFQMVFDDIQGNGIKPAKKSLVGTELFEVYIGPDECLLGKIAGVFVTARHAVGQIENGPLVLINKQGIGISFTLKDVQNDCPLLILLHPPRPISFLSHPPVARLSFAPFFFGPLYPFFFLW